MMNDEKKIDGFVYVTFLVINKKKNQNYFHLFSSR